MKKEPINLEIGLPFGKHLQTLLDTKKIKNNMSITHFKEFLMTVLPFNISYLIFTLPVNQIDKIDSNCGIQLYLDLEGGIHNKLFILETGC